MKRAWSDKGEISANKIIVATHFPFLNKNGSYFLKLYQHRSYVLALEGAQNVDGMYMDEMERGISFRIIKAICYWAVEVIGQRKKVEPDRTYMGLPLSWVTLS